ncbi:unnamed protein product [Toxocara canis]|uniref:PAS domain-containing protein n=1 Tax=Toxocara canis TaxID=6265 RepID=A0A183V750_TOXCA|nr:unnamed protein product [Toxocara canis]
MKEDGSRPHGMKVFMDHLSEIESRIPETDLTGRSLKEFVHPSDYEEFSKLGADAGDDGYMTVMRMKSVISPRGRNLNLKSALFKPVNCRLRAIIDEGGRLRVLQCSAQPAGQGSSAAAAAKNAEVPNGTYMTRHTCDMKFSYVSDRFISHRNMGSFDEFVMGSFDEFVMGSFDEFVMESFDEFVMESFDEFVMGSFDEFVMGSFDEFVMGSFDEFVMGSFDEFVMGSFDEFVMGSFDEFVMESFDEFVMGSFDEFVMGSFDEFVMGSFDEFVMGSFDEFVMGSFDEFVMGSPDEFVMGSPDEFVMGSFDEFVMGSFDEFVMGSFDEFVGSFDEFVMRSFDEFVMRSFDEFIPSRRNDLPDIGAFFNYILRHEARSLMGTSFYSLVHPADINAVAASMREMLSKGHTRTPYYRLIGADKTVVWVQTEATTVNHTSKGHKGQYVICVHELLGKQGELESFIIDRDSCHPTPGISVHVKKELDDSPDCYRNGRKQLLQTVLCVHSKKRQFEMNQTEEASSGGGCGVGEEICTATSDGIVDISVKGISAVSVDSVVSEGNGARKDPVSTVLPVSGSRRRKSTPRRLEVIPADIHCSDDEKAEQVILSRRGEEGSRIKSPKCDDNSKIEIRIHRICYSEDEVVSE